MTVSSCCGAQGRVYSGDEGTNHMVCTKCGRACDMVEKKRMFNEKEMNRLISKFVEVGMVKLGNLWFALEEESELKDFIASEIRRNLKEFAVEIKRPVMEGYMDIEYALDSALKKRGIDL